MTTHPEISIRSAGPSDISTIVELIRALAVYERLESECAADPVALAIKRADLADKHFDGDAQVDKETAQRLGQEAQERLELLDHLARAPAGPISR